MSARKLIRGVIRENASLNGTVIGEELGLYSDTVQMWLTNDNGHLESARARPLDAPPAAGGRPQAVSTLAVAGVAAPQAT